MRTKNDKAVTPEKKKARAPEKKKKAVMPETDKADTPGKKKIAAPEKKKVNAPKKKAVTPKKKKADRPETDKADAPKKKAVTPKKKKAAVPEPDKAIVPEGGEAIVPEPDKAIMPEPDKVDMPEPDETDMPEPDEADMPEGGEVISGEAALASPAVTSEPPPVSASRSLSPLIPPPPQVTAAFPKKALLLAAGLGTRLRPLTLGRPKPMMTLWDVPLLERALHLMESWGVEEIAVNTHWLPEMVEEWLAAWHGTAKVWVSHEPEILGTGGALRPLRGFFGDEPFWMMNADIVASLDPTPLVEAFQENGFAAAWLEQAKGPRTVTVRKSKNWRVSGWRTPMPGVTGTATFTGLQLLSPRIFDFLPDAPFSSIVDAYERAMAQRVYVRGVMVPDSYWDDAGTPEAYLRIHWDVKRLAATGKRGGELYDPAADWHRDLEGTFFCVGAWVKVPEDKFGLNSVVLGEAEILAGGWLDRCIVADGCVGGRLENTICIRPVECGQVRALEAMGWPADRAVAMSLGERGSNRSFWRLQDGERVAIYIRYSLERPENARYAGHAQVLAEAGVPVPKVLADLPEDQCLVLEDCGSDSLLRRMSRRNPKYRANTEEWYRSVIKALTCLHRRGTVKVIWLGVTLEPRFDAALYAWERGLFEEHLLKARYGLGGLPEKALDELKWVATRLSKGQQVLVHRDFQSSNILFRGPRERNRLGGHGGDPVFIDFQGMRFGAGAYDLASLLYDPYVILDDPLRERLAVYYGECFPENSDAVALLHEAAVQRLVQALGAFGRLAAAGQPEFAQYIPQALANLLSVADELGFDALRKLTKEMISLEKKIKFKKKK